MRLLHENTRLMPIAQKKPTEATSFERLSMQKCGSTTKFSARLLKQVFSRFFKIRRKHPPLDPELVDKNQPVLIYPNARRAMNIVKLHRHPQTGKPNQDRMQSLMFQNLKQAVNCKKTLPSMPINVNHVRL